MILELEGRAPKIDPTVFIAPDATIIGDVTIGDNSSVWFKSVIRGDISSITIGSWTNIQDLTIVHVPPELSAEIGNYVTIGHRALIHGCKIGNNCLIGMGAIIMNGAEIGDNCIIGAGSLVTEGTKVPSGSLALGLPAKVKRDLTYDEIEAVKKSALNYNGFTKRYGSSVQN